MTPDSPDEVLPSDEPDAPAPDDPASPAAPPPTPEPPTALQGQWLLCAVAAAGARFVPVPLVDDAIRGRAQRTAVGLTLGACGRTIATRHLSPLYSTGSMWRAIAGLPLEILLLPIRRIVKIVRAARGVPRDLLQTWLLGRAVWRALHAGALQGDDPDALKAEATILRTAFDASIEGLDLTVLSAALGGVMDQVKGMSNQALAFARQLAGLEEGDHATPAPEGVDDPLGEALATGEVQGALAAFDARFDAAWAEAR